VAARKNPGLRGHSAADDVARSLLPDGRLIHVARCSHLAMPFPGQSADFSLDRAFDDGGCLFFSL
jgi:hypothetical protein